MTFSTLCCAAIVGSTVLYAVPSLAAAAGNTQGVTPTTITIGIPYQNLALIDQTFGLNINQGNYPDAYNALIADLNAHGGINGRKVVPKFAAVNPASTTSGATVCSQLVQDDHVFVAIAPYFGICYLEHGMPTVEGTVAGSVSANAAPNFTLAPPASVYDPIQLAVLTKKGVFKGKKVGVWGSSDDSAEVKIVDAALAKDRVDVVQTAIDSAPPTDSVGSAQDDAVIAQRFQSAGVNEVVAVGAGSTGWPREQQANQSSYNPPWVATDWNALDGYVVGSSVDPTYVKNVVSTTPFASGDITWKQPAVQKCVQIIKKAYPHDAIASPVGQSPSDTSNTTYVAPAAACQNMAIFTMIAKAAGKKLTTSSFERAGYGLRNVVFPGETGPVSFGPGQAYGIGPVYIARYDATTKQLQNASQPASQ